MSVKRISEQMCLPHPLPHPGAVLGVVNVPSLPSLPWYVKGEVITLSNSVGRGQKWSALTSAFESWLNTRSTLNCRVAFKLVSTPIRCCAVVESEAGVVDCVSTNILPVRSVCYYIFAEAIDIVHSMRTSFHKAISPIINDICTPCVT